MLDNKYSKWYNSIIQNAQARVLEDSVYTENHHILPRACGGLNNKENLVKLTAREHYIVHLLLVRFTEGQDKKKMLHAAWYMANTFSRREHKIKINSTIYERLKTEFISSIRGKNHHNYGKDVLTEEGRKRLSISSASRKGKVLETTKLKISQAHKGRIHTSGSRKRMSEGQIGKKYSEEMKKKVSENSKKMWASKDRKEFGKLISQGKCKYLYEVIFPDGKIEIFKNLSKFAREHNLIQASCRNVIIGESYHTKGYKFKIIGEIKHD